MTQTQQIREYLVTHPDGITPMEALEKFGCFRLGARIHDIKHGVGCDSLPVVTENESRAGKTYARYKAGETPWGTPLFETKVEVKQIGSLCINCLTGWPTKAWRYGKCDGCGKVTNVVTQ